MIAVSGLGTASNTEISVKIHTEYAKILNKTKVFPRCQCSRFHLNMRCCLHNQTFYFTKTILNSFSNQTDLAPHSLP